MKATITITIDTKNLEDFGDFNKEETKDIFENVLVDLLEDEELEKYELDVKVTE